MKPRLAIVFLLLVITPLVLLAWLGLKASQEEGRLVEDRFREVFVGQLTDLESQIGRGVAEVERQLYAAAEAGEGDAADLRGLVRGHRLLRQVFVRGDAGQFIHPPADPSLRTSQEIAFFDRTRSVWESGVQFGEGGANWQIDAGQVFDQQSLTQGAAQQQLALPQAAVQQAVPTPSQVETNVAPTQKPLVRRADPATGWYGWYWGDGLNWIYWRQPHPGGEVVGIEVDRMAFISDIISSLPTESAIPGARASLADARGETIYQWGEYEQGDGEEPVAELALGMPLAGWRLHYFAEAPVQAAGLGGKVGVIGGFASVGFALLGLAVYFYRENGREVREAAQRVTFVNQVSHELKTPLTNIRMYAELAGEKLDPDADPGLRKCLDVVADESGRLSRLIGNVLTFGKKNKRDTVRPRAGDVDDVVAATIDLFRPALERAQVEVEVESDAGHALVDADALEQILANLFSNVEKYAVAGGWMRVRAERDGEMTRIVVEDRGPGIPRRARERVFAPFARLSDEVTEGASGTGIGLSIARELARSHGGDLQLEEPPEGSGCRFVLTLRTPDCRDRMDTTSQ